jgi:hypothetical protein
MAFQNVLFPNPKLIHGLKKEFAQQTKIISNGNAEYRISKNQMRRIWTWPARNISATEWQALVTFMSSVNFSLDSFRFYCPLKKQEYHVRFDMASFSTTAEAFDTSNTVVGVNMGDIVLIQVFE